MPFWKHKNVTCEHKSFDYIQSCDELVSNPKLCAWKKILYDSYWTMKTLFFTKEEQDI